MSRHRRRRVARRRRQTTRIFWQGVADYCAPGPVPGAVRMTLAPALRAALHPEFVPVAEGILLAADRAGLDLVVVDAVRDPQEQARLWALGRVCENGVWRLDDDPKTEPVTYAPPGSSPHEHGLAIDCCPRILLTQRGWAPASPLWPKYGAIVKACGGEWGGDFTRKSRPFPDRPHAQMAGWKRFRRPVVR